MFPGPARISTGGWLWGVPVALPSSLPCTCNSISYKNHIYIALFANDWLRQWIWMGDEVGFRALLRKWGAASPSDGRKRIRMAFHPSGIFFSHYEEYYYMCYDTEACFTTTTHEDNNCFMNISGREDIFCHMEEHTHPRHVAAGNGTWDDVIMEIHMKRKDSFALRLCVMKENVIYYKSKLVDKRTEVPLNWRSLPVQELPEFTSLTPLP